MNEEKLLTRRASAVLLITVVMILIMSVVLLPLNDFLVTKLGRSVSLVIVTICLSLSIGLPSFFYYFKCKPEIKKIFMFRGFKLSNFIISIVIIFLMLPFSSLLSLLTMKLGAENYVDSVMLQVMDLPLALLLLAFAIVPAIVEEIVFRGVLFSHFKKLGFGVGVFVSAWGFALLHGNINQVAYAFFLGIVLAILVEINNSIFVGIFVHMLFNAVSIIAGKLTNTEAIDVEMSWSIVSVLIAQAFLFLVVGILLIFYIAKKNNKLYIFKGFFKSEGPNKHIFNPFLVIASLILIALMLSSLLM